MKTGSPTLTRPIVSILIRRGELSRGDYEKDVRERTSPIISEQQPQTETMLGD
jgi:hypothetical protein